MYGLICLVTQVAILLDDQEISASIEDRCFINLIKIIGWVI